MLPRFFATMPAIGLAVLTVLQLLCPAADAGEENALLRLKADDLAALMEYHADKSRFSEAAAKGRDAFRYYMALGDTRTACRVLARAGGLNMSEQRFNEARQDFDTALALQEKIGDTVGACFTRHLLVRLALRGPRPSEALSVLSKAFDDSVGNDLRGPIMLLGKVSEELRARLIESAPAPAAYFELCDREASFWLAAKWPFNAQKVFHERIAVLNRDNRADEAARASAELVSYFAEAGDRYGESSAWHNLGLVLSARAASDDAAFAKADEAFEKAERIRLETGDDVGRAWALNNRGYMRLARKAYADALPFFEEANTVFGLHKYVDGSLVVMGNLSAMARAQGDDAKRLMLESSMEMLRKSRTPDPEKFEFTPKRADLAYYMFLRDDDRSPIVLLRGEKSDIVLTLAYTGDEFRVPVSPTRKEVYIRVKSPSALSPDSAAAVCLFRIAGNRTVTYGDVFAFLSDGSRAVADREGNLYLGDGSPASLPEVPAPDSPLAYPSLETPSLALKTAIECFNRGDWETFGRSMSWFALRWISKESFDATSERRKELPVNIRVTGAKTRNPSWVELRYTYEADWDRVPALSGSPSDAKELKKEIEAGFASEFGENRYRAFMVREGPDWKLDFLMKE